MADQSVTRILQGKRPKLPIPLTAGVLFLTLTLSFSACTSKAQQNAPAPPPPTVEITTVAPEDTPIFAEYPAQTYARDLVEVRARVDGYIDKWLFKPGQQVQAGQPLYILDLRPYRAQVEQAQGSVHQAEADLSFAKQQVSLLQAEANLEAARANLIKAQQDFERLKPLVQQDAAAQQDLDAATAALRAAESNVRANEANVKQARLNTDTQVQSAEGRVQQQRGSLSTANLNLHYGTVRSPISGRVGDTLAPVGGLVTANSAQPLTTVVPLDPIWVRFKLSESQYLEYERLKHSAKGTVLRSNSFSPTARNSLMPVESRMRSIRSILGQGRWKFRRDSLIRSVWCYPDSLAGSVSRRGSGRVSSSCRSVLCSRIKASDPYIQSAPATRSKLDR